VIKTINLASIIIQYDVATAASIPPNNNTTATPKYALIVCEIINSFQLYPIDLLVTFFLPIVSPNEPQKGDPSIDPKKLTWGLFEKINEWKVVIRELMTNRGDERFLWR